MRTFDNIKTRSVWYLGLHFFSSTYANGTNGSLQYNCPFENNSQNSDGKQILIVLSSYRKLYKPHGTTIYFTISIGAFHS